MIILAHRGFWENDSEKNTIKSFIKAFKNGFGVESDIRDFNGRLVISHDIANKDSISLDTFFALYNENKDSKDLSLALNIKADGLQNLLIESLQKYNITNYFVFDMSVPDSLGYLKANINTFTRQSEYEMNPSFYELACGVWLDCFYSNWINKEIIATHLENNKKVCIVSPELHKMDYKKQWKEYKNIDLELNAKDNLMLCTDFVEKAREFFND